MVSTQGRTHGPPVRIVHGSTVALPRTFAEIPGSLLANELVQKLPKAALWLLFYLHRTPGQPFPRNRDLAELFGVNTSNLSDSMRRLRRDGLIEEAGGVCPGRPKSQRASRRKNRPPGRPPRRCPG